MILDARTIAHGTILQCDVVVVGSGPAGVPLALELAQRGIDVIVLEAGGEHYSQLEQSRLEGEVVNPSTHHPLDRFRVRQFGGGSNLWGGRCAPYQDIDFEPREWVPHSGWPIANRALKPFYERASNYLDLGEFCYDARECLDPQVASPFPQMAWGNVSDTTIWRYSLPTNMRQKYRRQLQRLTNLRVLLHASCLELRTSSGGERVSDVFVATGVGRRLSISARAFVLACGAIETARLLMVSRDNHAAGLGNAHDLVGRYYQTHLYGTIAKLKYSGNPRQVRYGFERSRDGVYVQRMLTLRPEAQRRERLRNFCAVLHNPDFNNPDHRSAVLSSVFLVKWLISRRLPAELLGGGLDLKHRSAAAGASVVGRHIRNVVSDAPNLASFSWTWLTKRILSARKLPGVQVYNRDGEYPLLYSAEQEPNPDSRISLATGRDDFGYHRAKADWRFTTGDVEGIVANHAAIAREIGASPRPLLTHDIDLTTLADRVRASANVGSHHIGTARMSETPRSGVVDAACRVHGVANLYLAGSATFPTSSCMSVTLLIVALALRVSDSIVEQLPQISH